MAVRGCGTDIPDSDLLELVSAIPEKPMEVEAAHAIRIDDDDGEVEMEISKKPEEQKPSDSATEEVSKQTDEKQQGGEPEMKSETEQKSDEKVEIVAETEVNEPEKKVEESSSEVEMKVENVEEKKSDVEEKKSDVEVIEQKAIEAAPRSLCRVYEEMRCVIQQVCAMLATYLVVSCLTYFIFVNLNSAIRRNKSITVCNCWNGTTKASGCFI